MSQIFNQFHQAVMVKQVLKGLNVHSEGIYLDATFGRGGHTRAILAELGQEGRLLAMDRDPEAIRAAESLLADPRFCLKKAPFSKAATFCQENSVMGKVNGVLVDLGVSSPQLDTPERGFSFRLEGDLDMRMDPESGLSAQAWLNEAEEADISRVLKEYGEERFHKRIAQAIVKARLQAPITSTFKLAAIIAEAHPAWEKHKHPATRSFQAIRIFINNELGELSEFLTQVLSILAPQGRLVVISFHSLEDRIVKRFIQAQEKPDHTPKEIPIPYRQLKQPVLGRVGQKLKPSAQEIAENPRARSAVLRVAEKVGAA